MADTQQPVEQQAPSHVEQQVTSKTPTTKQKKPKRVTAGKAIAERTRIAREAQKKALIEAQCIIAQTKPAPTAVEPPPVLVEPPPETSKNVLTITQWLSIISIFVSLAGVYYKREEIKNVFTKKAAPLPRTPPPSPVLSRAPAAPKRSIRNMD